MKFIIFTDGASRGNPGLASYGYTISDDQGNIINEKGEYIGTTTNNVAEYSAVLNAFKYLLESYLNDLPIEINLFADSKLVAEQLSGRWRIKNENLKLIFNEIKVLENKLGKVTYTHVYRSQNKRADSLANQALDSL